MNRRFEYRKTSDFTLEKNLGSPLSDNCFRNFCTRLPAAPEFRLRLIPAEISFLSGKLTYKKTLTTLASGFFNKIAGGKLYVTQDWLLYLPLRY